ncbi:MAG: hypothetical protein U9Q85_02425 [Patescibacteria group bacterium]|nr:hypothetical protein [Patescibacteria group bacterium]
MTIKSKKILIFALWLIIFLVLLKNSFSYLDPDLGWHLQIGQQIITEKSVPSIEYYNYPLLKNQWTDHEWLLNALTFFIFSKLGYFSLTVFYALLIIASLLLIKKIIINNYPQVNELLLVVIFLGGILSARPSLGVRLQEFTLLFLAILFFILDKYAKTKNIKTLYSLPLLFFIWANAHGGFILGLGLLLVYIILILTPNFWNKILNKLKVFQKIPSLSSENKTSFLLLFLIAIISTLFTPYGIKLYELLGEYSGTFYLSHILEWLPGWRAPIMLWQMIYTAISVCFIAITIINIKNNKQKINPWYFFLALFFFVFTIKSRRHFPLFFIASLPLLFHFFANLEKLPKDLFNNRFVINFIKTYSILGIILGSTLVLLTTSFTNNPFADKGYCKGYPCDALEFLKTNNYQNTTFLNPFHWGGYLMWIWPEKLLFIDGRFPQLPYDNHTYLQEYFSLFEKNNIKNKINQYNTDLIMLSIAKPFKLNWMERNVLGYTDDYYRDPNIEIKKYLNSAKEWDLIYNDDISLIYSKK